ncbi:DMT family transporter [Actinomadura atramentaria]|uniref:DMT family transporter n=1 Tax=Actinomadura atramentaria TaxID=1990 RepID=UPI00037D30E0|nr:DMT family transporter [Actinomadura atramentaria]
MGDTPGHVVLALLASSAYYVSFVMFRSAAVRMPPLRGSRPFAVARLMATSPTWFGGGLVLFIGLGYEIVTFTAMPMALAQPVFAVSLVLLLVYTGVFLGERMSGREWTSIGLFVAATVLIGLSARGDGVLRVQLRATDVLRDPWLMLGVMAPALLAAILVWIVGDRRAGGRHARRLAGVAYGIGAGACAGLAEAGVRGMAILFHDTGSFAAVARSPYPYLTLVFAGIALGQLQVALQRCRLSVVASVLTVIGRTYLLLSSMILFEEKWPDRVVPFALRTAGLVLAVLALVVFPRYESGPEPGAVRRNVP